MIIDEDFLIDHRYHYCIGDPYFKREVKTYRFNGIEVRLVGNVTIQRDGDVLRDTNVDAFINTIEKIPVWATVHYWIVTNKPSVLTTAMKLSPRSRAFNDYYQKLKEGKYIYPCLCYRGDDTYSLVLMDTDFNNSSIVWDFIGQAIYDDKLIPIGELQSTPYFDIKFFAKYYDYPLRPIEKLCETMQTGEVVYIPTGAGLDSLCVLAKNDIISIDANLVNEVITFYYKHGGSVAITTPPKMFDYYFNLLITLLRGVEND